MTRIDPESIARVRAFNRFWTARIGVLDANLLDTPFSLTQARVLYELNQVDDLPVSSLLAELRVDPGYLSRLLKGLAARGLVTVAPDPADRRRRLAALTPAGRATAADLDRRSVDQLNAMLQELPPDAVTDAVSAMSTVQSAFDGGAELPPRRSLPSPTATVTLRDLRPGDLGWVIGRHGALYADEYSWDMSFEALVARIVADFAASHDVARERAWIADTDGAPAGCVFCVRKDDETAQLRLLLVEPSARGLGVGSALVRACLDFARAAGYRRIVLWTNDVLTAARRIYDREGFTLIEEESHTSFGRDLVGQYWGREL